MRGASVQGPCSELGADEEHQDALDVPRTARCLAQLGRHMSFVCICCGLSCIQLCVLHGNAR